MVAFFCRRLPALYQAEYQHTRGKKQTMYSLNAYNVGRRCYSDSKQTKTHTDTHTDTHRNKPSTVYCVPNHFSLRGHWPSCSGDNSIRLAFSGVRSDKAALIT